MKNLYMPKSEAELAMIKSLLVSEGIQFNVIYHALGAGPLIKLFNKRIIQVPEDQAQRALDIIQDYLGSTTRRIKKHALYKGKRLMIETASEQHWNVLLDNGNEPLPGNFLLDQKMQERYIYYGRIRIDDPELQINEEAN